MTIATRNLIIALTTVLLVVLFGIYLWAPSFLRNQFQSEYKPQNGQGLFATSSRSITGTISSITDTAITISVPASALEAGAPEALRTRSVVLTPDTEIYKQGLRIDQEAYEAELEQFLTLQAVMTLTEEEYQAGLASSTVTVATSTVPAVGINPNLPTEYRTAPPRSFEEFVASTTAAIRASSSMTLDTVPRGTEAVSVPRSVLAVGMVIAVVGSEPVVARTEITAEKIIVME